MMKKKGQFKRILVATDFSTPSELAVLRAIDLVKKTKAQLTLLHVIKKGFLGKMLEGVAEKFLITPEEYATTLLKKQVEKLSINKITANYAIISGNHPGEKILSYANDHATDLIIIGAHGKYSVRDCFVGTTAEYVAKKTKCPVLIIKRRTSKTYQKVLVPIDFSAASKEALQLANQLFSSSDLHILHVGDNEYEELLDKEKDIPEAKLKTMRDAILNLLAEKTKKFLKLCGVKASYTIKIGYPGIVILDEIKKSNRDLVIMGTEGHSQRHYLFFGRVASMVLTEVEKDILLVPPKTKSKK